MIAWGWSTKIQEKNNMIKYFSVDEKNPHKRHQIPALQPAPIFQELLQRNSFELLAIDLYLHRLTERTMPIALIFKS